MTQVADEEYAGVLEAATPNEDTEPAQSPAPMNAPVRDLSPAVLDPGEAPPLAETLLAAAEGDPVAQLRVDLVHKRRAERDLMGELVTYEKKFDEVTPSTPESKVVELEQGAAATARALEEATAEREMAEAVLLRAQQDGSPGSPTGRLLRFSSVGEFVSEFAVPNWGHELGGKNRARWCEQWWLHPAALFALDALWESFEAARLEPPPAIAAWARDFFWPFMTELTREDGVFRSCVPRGGDHRSGHTPESPWPDDTPPQGWVPTYPSESTQVEESSDE